MKIIFKERLPNTNEVSVYNFKKTANGINLNGKEIDILSKFKSNSYMIVFLDMNGDLIYLDGKKLQEKGIDGFLELRYAFSQDYNDQLGCVWFGNTEEDITVIVNIPVFFLDENFDFEIKSGLNLDILKNIYPEANDLLISFNNKKQTIKDFLLF